MCELKAEIKVIKEMDEEIMRKYPFSQRPEALNDNALFCASVFLDIAEKDGIEIARAEWEVAIARAKLRKLRNINPQG